MNQLKTITLVAEEQAEVVCGLAKGKWLLLSVVPKTCPQSGDYKASEISPSSAKNAGQTPPNGVDAQVLVNVSGCASWVGLNKVDVVCNVKLDGGQLVQEKKELFVFCELGELQPFIVAETVECEDAS